MVVLNRIYTRTGDDGTTVARLRRAAQEIRSARRRLWHARRGQCRDRLVRLHTTGDAQLDAMLARIQNDIFDVEADLCILDGSKGKGPGGAKLNVTEKQVEWIEQQIDALNETLPPLRSFILPGGTPAAAYLHLARTMCRRAERLMVELRDQPGEEVTPEAIQYVNRLSDFLFVAGRHANDRGAKDVLWQPGQNR